MLISRFSKIEEKDIMAMEKSYNIVLPKDYVDFLVTYNGGLTPDTDFRLNKISSDIVGFYGIGNVDLSFDSIDVLQWVKNNFFPIAEDSFGNYIVINLSSNYFGQIFFCDHELGFKASYIAKNIREFCEKCRSELLDEFAKKLSKKERLY